MLQLILMCALMGAASFGCGMLPLAFAFSKSHIERLSAVGTGLLLGAALGVIVPEGIESIVEANKSSEVPTTKISLALLCGFTFMLLIEQLGIGGHSHGSSGTSDRPSYTRAKQSAPLDQVEFDAELDELERDESGRGFHTRSASNDNEGPLDLAQGKGRALPLTLGLVVHSFADGFALGVSALSPSDESKANTLSLIVFLALILHKAPTSLALSTQLLASSLPRIDCKKHLAVFSAATPASAIICYLCFTILGSGEGNDWTGIALLLSGGTFLYVATVLQPVSHHSSGGGTPELPRVSRVLLIVIGLFIPILLSSFLGHGH
ncbi:hypothetical protein CC1G_02991 [Coprinopsis cinerea okayama7|uniref:Zinc/iron permease n=1 Tax=Coprinopsis cinerea (strain Okayama-7 / 130 / ATCC MYA-4618 / FGSC 9003) TaxID=240176 RepID=A8NS05_COPC7|nr:hypothetical protein CC1G_02991 [Coprinopsis cinerea okayama7\|eukprot:XP_001835903.2 hypothetical protein CC1G_02991 [Coprinopsis cinerea okayama7\